MRIRIFTLSLVLLGVWTFKCTNIAGGNGTETTNGYIVGQFVEKNGAPAARTRVMLVAQTYNPVKDGPVPDSLIDTTDANGTFKLHAEEGVTFNIEAIHPGSGNRALITDVTIIKNDTDFIQPHTIQQPGAVQWVPLSSGTAFEGYLYLPGTTRFGEIINGYALIDSVPAGRMASMVYTDAAGSEKDSIVSTGITVSTGDTTVVIDSSVWLHSKTIHLNTTETGADVAGNVTDFPVLIRLSGSTFDFNQADANGEDLRFITRNGKVLPHEIERWDPVTELAEVWVKVDTIRGNDRTQSITMYWGNSTAAGGSNSAEVFDTVTGFQGVWHLAEPANSNSFDATANRYHGTPSDTAPLPVEGVIGNAKEFNGISSGIRMEGTDVSTLNFNENDRYTLSAWVYSDTIDEKWHFIAGKGQTQYYLKQQIKSKYGNWEFVEFHDRAAWQMTITPAVAKTWKLLTGVRDGNRQYLYLDGELIDSTIKQNSDAETISRNVSEDFTIGRHQDYVDYSDQGYCFFDGQIDEVRISNAVRSIYWIRLCYMNQREDDKLVQF
jgi:hypothetical protein